MAEKMDPEQEKELSEEIHKKIWKEEHSTSSSEEEDIEDFLYCEICEKKFSGLQPFKQHLDSKKHMKAVQRERMVSKHHEENEVTEDFAHFVEPYKVCKPCKKELGSPESYQLHIASRAHKRKVSEHALLKQVKRNGKINSDELIKVYNEKRTKNEEKSLSETDKLEEKEEKTDDEILNNDEFECKLCKKVFSGITPYIQHMTSKCHSKEEEQANFHKKLELKESEEPSTSSGEKTSSLQIHDGVIVCKICNMSFSGSETATHHIKGRRHSSRLEILLWKEKCRNKSSPCTKKKEGRREDFEEYEQTEELEKGSGKFTETKVNNSDSGSETRKESVIKITLVKKETN